MRRLGRPTDILIVGAALLTLIPFHYAIASRSNLAIAEISVLIMCGLLFLSGHWRLPRQFFWLATSVFATFIWILVSCQWSADKNFSFNTASIYGIAALLFIGLLVAFKDKPRRNLWLYGYLAVAAITSIIGFITLDANGAGRLEIGLMLSNAVAGFLLPATLVVIFNGRQLAGKNPLGIILFWMAGFSVLAGFFLTFSRGGWFCFVIAAAFIAWFRYPKKFVLAAAVITLVGLSVMVMMFSNHARQPAQRSLVTQGLERDAGGTLHDRKIYAKSAWDMFIDHLIIGAGSGSYRIESVSDQSGASIYSVNAHASLLQFGAEFGLVGLVLLGNVIFQIVRLIKINRERVVIIGATFGLALHFLVEIDLLYPLIVFLLASLAALSVSLGRNHIGKAS
jgi:hypothetical protein